MKYNNIGKMGVVDFVTDAKCHKQLVKLRGDLHEHDNDSQICKDTASLLEVVDKIREAIIALEIASKTIKPYWIIMEKIKDNYEDLSKYTTERSYQDLLRANNNDDLKDDGK